MDDRALIRSLEGIHDRRFLGFTALALLVFAIVVGRMVVGFRGNDVSKGADAMTLVGSSSSGRAVTPTK